MKMRFWVLFGLSALTTTLHAASAQTIEDPRQIGWSSIRNYSSSEFADDFNRKSAAGYRVIDIEAARVNGKLRYSAIWQRNSDKRKWKSLRNQSNAQFSKSWNDLKGTYRLIDQEKYKAGSKWRYAGVWVENKEKVSWRSYRNLDNAAFKTNFKSNRAAGFRMIDIDMHCDGRKMLYSSIWVKNKKNLAWAEFRNMSASQYAEKFKSLGAQGYRVLDIESCRRGNTQLYAAIWVKNTNKRGWRALRDMTAQGFANQWRRSNDLGLRLDDFEVYSTRSGVRYAGVWRQNNNRLAWSHRKAANKLVDNHRNKNGIPGLSVAIGKGNKLIYVHGSGFADIKKKAAAHGGTIYRLASVSKPVTVLMAMRLIESGKLDINRTSRSYLRSLPSHHTHTVKQTLNHYSGIRHYKGSRRPKNCSDSDPTCCVVPKNVSGKDSSKKQYDVITKALRLFQKDALLHSPGSKKCYSTHAYTVAGGVFESITSKSMQTLLAQHFGNSLGLPTLRAELIKKPLKERAAIYSSATKKAKFDNTSWKLTGGGMVASAKDMARLGLKLFNGQVAKESTRKIFWPEEIFSHAGGQTGAASYWKLDFKNKITVIVLTNRKAGKSKELAEALYALAK